MNAQEQALWNDSDQPRDWSTFDFTNVRTGFLMKQVALERRTRRFVRDTWATPSTDAVERVFKRLMISVKVEAACRIELKTRERLQRLPKEVRRQNHLARVAAKTYEHRDIELARCSSLMSKHGS